jgi:hypothetical protein
MEKRMRTRQRRTAASLLLAFAGAVSVIAAGLAGHAVASYVIGGPRVGHIIAFAPSPPVRADDRVRLPVLRVGSNTCVLDLSVIRRFGGSLVLERLIAGEVAGYQVHWAGERTSNDTDDCGADAILVLRRQDLDGLAVAAGGYGVGKDRATPFALDIFDN